MEVETCFSIISSPTVHSVALNVRHDCANGNKRYATELKTGIKGNKPWFLLMSVKNKLFGQ